MSTESSLGEHRLLSRSSERRCSVPEADEAVAAAEALMIHADAMDEAYGALRTMFLHKTCLGCRVCDNAKALFGAYDPKVMR